MIDDLGVDRQIRHTSLRHDRDFPDSCDLTQALFNTRKIVRFVRFEPNGETFQQRGCRTGQRQHQPQNHANGREKENPRTPPKAIGRSAQNPAKEYAAKLECVVNAQGAALSASRSYVYAVARACDHGLVDRKDAAGCILFAAEKATWMALEAIQILGGNGYVNDFPTGRLLRDAKLYEIGAGTSEIRRILIGRELFRETE